MERMVPLPEPDAGGLLDEERQRLARDLHDGVQQTLIVLGTRIALAESLARDSDRGRRARGGGRRTIRERVGALGGGVGVSSAPGSGTIVAGWVPAGRLPAPPIRHGRLSRTPTGCRPVDWSTDRSKPEIVSR